MSQERRAVSVFYFSRGMRFEGSTFSLSTLDGIETTDSAYLLIPRRRFSGLAGALKTEVRELDLARILIKFQIPNSVSNETQRFEVSLAGRVRVTFHPLHSKSGLEFGAEFSEWWILFLFLVLSKMILVPTRSLLV